MSADLAATFAGLFGAAEMGALSGELSYLLQTRAWRGELFTTEGRSSGHTACRALVWRVFLHLLPDDKTRWDSELCRQEREYIALREHTLPSFDKASVFDPLLGEDTSSGGGSGNWKEYYKGLEVSTFIDGDLDRLYMNGVEDSYFQTSERRRMLLNVLLLWSLLHRDISYRQGMHEIAGPILMVIEEEHAALRHMSEQFPHAFCSVSGVEAHAYFLFERLMSELVVLYDPRQVVTAKDARDNHPPVVHFCTKLQEHFLLEIDPDLCSHLEGNFVQAQLYGLRWSRLILGREFPFSHSHAFRVWDAIFASSRRSSSSSSSDVGLSEEGEEDTLRSNYSRASAYSPLLVAIGNFMLAMLLHVRDDLLAADSTTILNHLLRYPPVESVVQILDYADMIRRGVLSRGAHIYSPPQVSKVQRAPLLSRTASSSSSSSGSSDKNATPPSWLTTGSTASAKIGSGLTNLRESVQGGLARAAGIRTAAPSLNASTQTDPVDPAAALPTLPPVAPAAVLPSRQPPPGGAVDGRLNRQLSERLLDLADALAKVSAPASRGDINSVLFSLSPGGAPSDGTADAVSRLRLLADVASGLMSVADYDNAAARGSGLKNNNSSYVL